MASQIEAFEVKLDTRLKEIIAGNETEVGSNIRYTNDIESVQRYEQKGQQYAKVPAIVPVYVTEEIDQSNQAQKICRRRYALLCVYQDTDDNTSTAEIGNSLLADMQKAIEKDPTFTDTVEDVDQTGSWAFEPDTDQPLAGIALDIEVQYKISNKDPDRVVYP